ncbi:MAG: glycosyltransferase family 4 protein [Nanoarchaeota archaeon]
MLDRKIFIYQSSPLMHSHARLMIKNPPKGYKFIVSQNVKKNKLLSFLSKYPALKLIYRSFLKPIINPLALIEKTYSSNIPLNMDFVFSESQALDINQPWILHVLDSIYALGGNDYQVFLKNKDKIERRLLSEYCRRIIVVNESTLRDMKKYFSKEVMKKVVLIRAAVNSQSINREYNKKNLSILFMGSIANPDDFYMKGGLETLEVFKKLSVEFSNLRLIMRCKLPNEIRKKYSNLKNTTFLENQLEYSDIYKLYKNADILLNPAHAYPLMTLLESMSFGLPIVMLDTYAVRDYLTNNNALIVKPSKDIQGYHNDSYPTNVRSKEFLSSIKKNDREVIDRLSLAVRKLILSPSLREKFGKESVKLIRKKFSLEKRNLSLKKVFDNS